jgi:glycosyltransferase involved in cell wall biosynthesis
MKIVLINTYDAFGGAARSMFRLHKGLRSIGVESTVLCINKISNDGFTELVQMHSGVEADSKRQEWRAIQQAVNSNLAKDHCGFLSLPVPGYDLSLHRAVREADVIHLHWVAGMLSPESIAALLALNKPVVWTLHDMRAFTGGCHFSDNCRGFQTDCAECPMLKSDYNHLARFNLEHLIKIVDARNITVVTPSRWLGNYAKISRFFSNSRVEVIPYGLETNLFSQMDRVSALNKFGLEPGPMTFLFGADNIMEPRKGVKILVDSMQMIVNTSIFNTAIKSGDVRFLSFGLNGSAFKNIPWVKDLGRISEDVKMCAAYSASDVFLCPTLEDNLPNTILESMSCGTPSIASRVGGVPDIITDGIDGWMFPVGDAGVLSSRIMYALTNREKLKKVGIAARLTVEERFGLELQAIRYKELYTVLLANGGQGRANKSSDSKQKKRVELKSLTDGNFFGAEEVANMKSLVDAFQKNPTHLEAAKILRNLRLGISEHLLGTEESLLQSLFENDYGEIYRLLAKSGLLDSTRATEEDAIAQQVRRYFENYTSGRYDVRLLLVAMLFIRAHEIGGWPVLNSVPEWLEDMYFNYIFYTPEIFFRVGEADDYCRHMRSQFSYLRGLIKTSPASNFSKKFAPIFLHKCNIIPLYFNQDSLRDFMEIRAELCDLVLRSMGAGLDYRFSKRAAGSKIRVGIFDAALAHRSETYVNLPVLRLDRAKFSVHLISLFPPAIPELEGLYLSMVDKFVILPKELDKQVKAIRELDLDVLIIGSNTCAVTNIQFLLSLHRLARLQMVSYCSPVTSGSRNVDAFITGELACVADSQSQFAERLILLPGPPGCMDYSYDRRPPLRQFSKAEFGVPEDSLLFISGANCFKIIPEIQEVWARVLASSPGSRLLLHPFNPNWTSNYPEVRFEESFRKTLQRHGVELDRLIISSSLLPARSDVVALMAIGDIYLDTFPYSGSISLTDPLEAAVPTLVCEYDSLRSRQGAALLRDLGLSDLITNSSSDYVAKAIELGRSQIKRQYFRNKITRSMLAKPSFLDPDRYSRNLGLMLEAVVPSGLDAWCSKSRDS